MIEILEPYLDLTDLNKIIYPIIIQNTKYDFYIHYDISEELDLNLDIDCIVVMLSSVAICNNWKIKSNLSIDEKLYKNLKELPNTYKKYHSKHTSLMSMIKYEEINLILDIPTSNKKIKKGLCAKISPVSMGIDSLQNILLNKNELTHLIYINKMDLSNNIDKFNDLINFISNRYNKQLIIANSNFKQMMASLKLNDIQMPGTNYAVFTSDAMLLASCYPLGIEHVYFSGFGCENFPCLMGQHSDVNKYFNSNEFTSTNNITNRIQKIDFITDKDIDIIKYIRVCNDNLINKKYLNCSKCRKCVVTMFYFYMLGYYKELKDTFLLPSEDEMKIQLNNINKTDGNIGLSSKYFNKIYNEYLKVYNKNNNKSIKNIIKNCSGDFINEEFNLSISK